MGCKEHSEYLARRKSVTIHPKNVGIKKVSVLPWRVGPMKKQEVSKGITISVKLPMLETDDLIDMTEKINVDSWIVRVRRERIATREQLQYLMIPFVRELERGIGKKILKQLPVGTVNIVYAAAAISSRLEGFRCPAFGHAKVIKEAELLKLRTPRRVVHASPADETRMDIKYEDFSYRPFSINGGNTLIGNYIFDMALFNSHENKRMSSWYQMDTQIRIQTEIATYVKGCAGSKIPERSKKGGGHFENFRFKR